MKNVIIFGIGLLGELVFSHIKADWNRQVISFCVDKEYVTDSEFCGLPVVAFERLFEAYPPHEHDVLVAVGYANLNRLRQEKIEACRSLGYATPNYISPHAIVLSELSPDANHIIFEGAVIQRHARLGFGCLVWPNAVICHHVNCGDSVFIGPGAIVCGGTTIGSRALIGAGAMVRDFLTVGKGAIVGAGCRLLRDLPDNALCADGESRVAFDCADKMVLWPPKSQR